MKNEIFKKQLNQGRLQDAGDFPSVVLIDSISCCDLRCSMCVHKDMTRKKGVMPWGLFTKIIDEIAREKRDARVWMVFFGEALILKRSKPSIFDMISYAKAQGLTDVVLNSNANLLDSESARKLIVSGLDAIYIGIDSFNTETYNKLRVGGNYKKVVNNVISLLNERRALKSKKPEVYLQFVVMDVNKAQQDDFRNFWVHQGAIVKIRPKVSWAGLIEAPNQVLGNKERWPCHWAMQTLSITDRGDVVLCPCDLNARFIAGNVVKNSLKEVWNATLKELRVLHQTKQFGLLPQICKECKDWQSARSDYYKE
jgi:radical SAM protein with 4Fe4S-binding SPASM domain